MVSQGELDLHITQKYIYIYTAVQEKAGSIQLIYVHYVFIYLSIIYACLLRHCLTLMCSHYHSDLPLTSPASSNSRTMVDNIVGESMQGKLLIWSGTAFFSSKMTVSGWQANENHLPSASSITSFAS